MALKKALLSSVLYDVRDPLFIDLIVPNAPLEQLSTGHLWTEGPVWLADQQCLLFSDIPNNRILRYSIDGQISVYRSQSHFANGHTRDHLGRLISCEHGTRRIVRTEVDGSVTVLADNYRGHRLNSPNDVVVHSDGSIWFTDPTYGILSDYEGFKADPELDRRHVFRLDPQSGRLEAVVDDFVQPNGLAFSVDESVLYVAESGASHDPTVPRTIRAFPVSGSTLGHGQVFAEIDIGIPDGIKVDENGNLWSSAGDGIHCFSPEGTLLGKIRIPQTVANLSFGGVRDNRLYITASDSLYAVYVNTKDAARQRSKKANSPAR